MKIQNEGTRQYIGYCLDPCDLAASKLAAGRAKDSSFVEGLLRHRIVTAEQLIGRIGLLPLDAERGGDWNCRWRRSESNPDTAGERATYRVRNGRSSDSNDSSRSSSTPISDATVTVNGEAVTWNAGQSVYVATNLVTLGATVELSVGTGGVTCTASGTQFTSGPVNRRWSSLNWLSAATTYHLVRRRADEQAPPLPSRVVLNGSGQCVFPAGGVPQDVSGCPRSLEPHLEHEATLQRGAHHRGLESAVAR